MPQDPGYPDLKTPKTRHAQSWTFFWTVYRTNLPRKLDKVNRHLLPAIRASLRR